MTDTMITTGPSHLTEELGQKLDMLLHVHEFSGSAILITGPAGSGKSSLLNAAQEQLSIHHQVAAFSATQINNEQELIIALASHLGCLPHFAEVEANLTSMLEQQEHLHLCIDDAHLLPPDVLEILFAKSLSANGWRLVLSGDPMLKQRADELQVNFQQESLYHLVALEALGEEGANQLVKDLYAKAGMDVLPLSAKQLHQLFLLSDGNGHKIVDLVDTEQRAQSKKATQFPLTHIAAVVLIGSALLVSSFYQEDAPPAHDDVIAQLLMAEPPQAGNASKTEDIKKESQQLPLPSDTSKKENMLVATEPVKSIELLQESEAPLTDLVDALPPNKQATLKESLAEQVPVKNVELEAQNIKARAEAVVTAKQDHPLLNAQGSSYVLQLLGVRKKSSADAFVARFSRQLNASDLNIYQTQYKGSPWYVVVYGPFDTKQLASKQAGNLAGAMKSTPWVRPLSKIQEDIRKYKQ